MSSLPGPLPTPRQAPMPPIATKEVYRVNFIGELEFQMTSSVLYYSETGAIGSASGESFGALALLLKQTAGVYDAYRAAASSAWSAKTLIIASPTSPGVVTYTQDLDPDRGLGPATCCPNQTAVVIHKRTQFGGKRGRGRISMPAVPTAWVIGTGLNDATAHDALALAMKTTLADQKYTFTPVVTSFSKDDPQYVGFNPITACVASTVLGTIRRRRPGYGK